MTTIIVSSAKRAYCDLRKFCVPQIGTTPYSSPHFASQRCGDFSFASYPFPLNGVAMSAPTILDRPRLSRLFAFIREHEDQARDAGDFEREAVWENLLNRLLENCPRR